MSILNGFPMVNQNTTITSDGRPSENASEDCVAASICAMCMYLNGVKQLDHDKYNPDKFKDMAYGESLHNSGTAASKYVNYCTALGVKLWSINGDYPSLIKQAHEYLAKDLPVMFTQDDWIVDTSLPQYQGWSHVAVWYADSPGMLTSMDPWGGFPRAKSDATWATLMKFNQIWVAERIAPVNTLPPGWHDDGTTLSTATGEFVLGFRAHVLPRLLAGTWKPSNMPLGKQYYTKQLEASNPLLGDGDQIITAEGMLGYPHNPQHPYEGMKNTVVEEYVGTELLYTRRQMLAYYAHITELEAQLQQAKQQGSPEKLTQIGGLASQIVTLAKVSSS